MQSCGWCGEIPAVCDKPVSGDEVRARIVEDGRRWIGDGPIEQDAGKVWMFRSDFECEVCAETDSGQDDRTLRDMASVS